MRFHSHLFIAAGLIALAACTPSIPDDVFVCTTVAECPPDFVCRDGFCRDDGTASAQLVSISVTPSDVTVIVGTSTTVTVTGMFDDGSSAEVTEGVSFVSAAEGVATVDAAGVVTGVAAGMTTVTAAVGDRTADASIVVVTPSLPLAVDDFFPGRGGFGDGGPRQHTEDGMCPMRAGDMLGECHRIAWDGEGLFTGDVWLLGTDFIDAMAVPVEAGAVALTFWAWGAAGGEVVEFGAGIDSNTAGGAEDGVQIREMRTLTATPARYVVSLDRLAGYEDVAAPFVFAANSNDNAGAMEFYIDDIQWVATRPPVSLPMTVDEHFPDRTTFGPSGPGLHTETIDECPDRGGAANGRCHTFVWLADGGFTGAFWTIGTDFTELESRAVEEGATFVRFWAWGRDGGELIEFGAGNADLDGSEVRQEITLTTVPTAYSIDISGLASRTAIFGPFIWAANQTNNPSGFEFYVDDIQWVTAP